VSKPLLLGLAVSIVDGACSTDFEAELYGEYVTFDIDEVRQPCAGTLPHLDRYVERAFEFLDASPPPPGWNVPVRVFASNDCLDTGGHACYLPSEGEIHVGDLDDGARASAVLRHELAHAVIHQVWGRSLPFFEEGLANSLSETRELEFVSSVNVPINDMMDREAREVDYTAAARFTRFLIDSRGLDRFRRLFTRVDGSSLDDVVVAFAEVYGEGFQELEDEYLSGAPRCVYQLDICDDAAIEAVDEVWMATFAASCDDPDFYGSTSAESAIMASQRTIELEKGGRYRFIASSSVILRRCGDCSEQLVHRFSSADVELDLPSGMYTIEISPTADNVVDVGLLLLE
jgi:hypothetical protein